MNHDYPFQNCRQFLPNPPSVIPALGTPKADRNLNTFWDAAATLCHFEHLT